MLCTHEDLVLVAEIAIRQISRMLLSAPHDGIQRTMSLLWIGINAGRRESHMSGRAGRHVAMHYIDTEGEEKF